MPHDSESYSSLEIYEHKLLPALEHILQSSVPLSDLAREAEGILDANGALAKDPRRAYEFPYPTKYQNDDKSMPKGISVELDRVMRAMLACAEACGGERAGRYVASAVVACLQINTTGGERMEALRALGITWLTRFLFAFKIGNGLADPYSSDSEDGSDSDSESSCFIDSGRATPTIENTTPRNRAALFHDEVLRRDAYTCAITGFKDHNRPPSPTEQGQGQGRKRVTVVNLVAARILPEALCWFDRHSQSASELYTTTTTFDIFVNYTSLPVSTPDALRARIDNPENGIALEKNTRDGFDDLYWWLNATERENVYELETLDGWVMIKTPEDNRVVFTGHSTDFQFQVAADSSPSPGLPNPHHIAIHAAIARVLNTSGAGRFFDEVLGLYRDGYGYAEGDDGWRRVRSWAELEDVMERRALREGVVRGFEGMEI